MEVASMALYYENSRLINGLDLVFYTEDKADVDFWTHVFTTYLPDKKIEFYYYTETNDGFKHKGKTVAFDYIPYLNKNFMICVDSDYDFIISTRDFDIEHYIFQTYTYSIENYKCYAPSLTELCKKATHHTDEIAFDITSFITRYSQTIFPLFIYSIADKINSFGFSISDFSDTIKLSNHFTDGESEQELASLQGRVKAKIADLNLLCSAETYEQAKVIVENKGITPANAYLFIKGHSLYDNIVLRLIKSIVDDIQSKKIKTLKDAGRVIEIESYLASCPKVDKLLDNNFNFFDCGIFERIKNDVQSIT
jgi:hypothetical protein